MNERNNHRQGHDRDWTNPSKCLVDKALEQWSTTRMRADNTSVVIVVIDPPGPPKRDVQRTSPQQQFIVEKSTYQDGVEEEGLQRPTVITNPDLNRYSLFDHRTNEMSDLDQIAIQNPSNTENDTWSESDCDDENGFKSLNYQSTYAAAYNPMIHPLADDPLAPQSYADQSVQTELPPKEEPYSLICLETGQTTTTGYYSPYDNTPSVSRNYETYNAESTNHNDHVVKDQFNSISSSFLSQSCGIIQNNLDASEHNDLINNMFSPIITPVVEQPTLQHLNESTIDYHQDHTYEKSASTLSSDGFNACDITIITDTGPDPDESIQIDEISSSSKENEANHHLPATTTVQYHIPLLRSSIKSLMRTTRSSKLPRTPSFDSRTKKPKTIAKKVVATKATPKCSTTNVFSSSRVSARRTTPLATTPLQRSDRRSVVVALPHPSSDASTKRISLRSTLDLCKRTLRSKNTIGFKATKTSTPVVTTTTKSLLTTPKPKNMSSTSAAISRSSRLRDKVRSSYSMLQSRPKLIVTSSSGRKLVSSISAADRTSASSKLCSSVVSATPKTTRSRFRKRLSR